MFLSTVDYDEYVIRWPRKKRKLFLRLYDVVSARNNLYNSELHDK